MPSDLVYAYLATDYVVFDGRKSVMVRVGQRSTSVDALLARWQAKTGAFITAWNPFGRVEDVGRNVLKNRDLKRHLIGKGFTCLSGEGRGRLGDWPPEASFFALSMSRPQAASVGRRLRQNAIVFVARGAPAELIMLRWLG